MKVYKIFCFVLIVLFLGCGEQKQKPLSSSEKLEAIIQEYQDYVGYDKEKYPLGLVSKDFYKAKAQFSKLLLNKLKSVSANELKETDRISYELLQFLLQEQIDVYSFECYLNPILSDSGFNNGLNYNVRSLNNHEQTKKYLKQLNALPDFIDQHLANMRLGLEKGISQPQVILEVGFSSTYNDHIVDNFEDSYFYKPFKKLPKQLNPYQKDSVLKEAKRVIENKVIPQFKRIKTFFDEEYRPNARKSIAITDRSNGEIYYRNRINYYTTDKDFTPEKIHEIGLKEVARIKEEMEEIAKQVGFEGRFEKFLHFLRTDPRFYAKTAKELIMFARDVAKRLDAQMHKFFITLPRKQYGVVPVPDALSQKYSAGKYIYPKKNSNDPGYYWVNTSNLKSRKLYTIPALNAHESVPGHHFQISANQELGDSIPQFRKKLYLSAYSEGWALYAEFLADEMGIYTTPYEQFGKLSYEMLRACRLVVDPGIHAKGWSRDKAIDYLVSHTALSIEEINIEVDRYISEPGQAVSYKIGELKIRKLRKKAELVLGDEFDLREFHEVILEQGTVTLAILEDRVNTYIEKRKKGE